MSKEVRKMTTKTTTRKKFVKVNVEVISKLIEQFYSRAEWSKADGNESVASYNKGMADMLTRVRNGDFS